MIDQALNSPKELESLLKCTHCDEEAVVPLYNETDLEERNPFCCVGCKTVYNVIHQKGLNEYYDIKSNSATYKRRSPVELKKDRFKYLDESEFLSEYSYSSKDNFKVMEFYLEGIHCLACLWLIEKLPEFITDVLFSRLDMTKSIATITINQGGQFSKVAEELNNLGYKPHPLKRNESTEALRKKEEQKTLLKIGIAGAASGNIMIYSVSIYAGADGFFLTLFSYITVILAFPVLLYSATPFYKSAYNAIKNKNLNIDVPIATGLLVGFFHGVYNLLIGSHTNYFDTLTDLVFLLLLSRYLLNKVQEKGLTANDLNFFYQTTSVLKRDQGLWNEIHPRFLKNGDEIKINSGEMIVADGTILEGKSTINASLLTGESVPEVKTIGEKVFSGTLNIDQDIVIKVEKTGTDSRLGNILKEVESGWIQKAKIVELTNRFSQYFIAIVFVLSIGVAIKFLLLGNPGLALEKTLTLLIVTCPCALALATPLALTHTLTRASKKGIIIKNDEVIEKLSKIKEVYLDKTGTVTFGHLKVQDFNLLKNPNISIFDLIIALEKKSTHPVAKALKEFAANHGGKANIEINNLKEFLGIGVSGFYENNFYEIKDSKVFCNQEVIATFELKDQIRKDSKLAIDIFKVFKIKPFMISGDKKEVAQNVGNQIGLPDSQIFSEVSPEKKLSIIESSENSLMVGDGANDAMALSKAYVGVAVSGSMDISLRAADVYLTTPGIVPIADLIIISKETMKVIYRNLSISVLYNIFSVIGVYMGFVSPVVAAIIMPASSLTVLISTIMGTRELNKRLKV